MFLYLEVIVLLIALPTTWFIVSYNLLVRDKNRVMAAWSDIDVQLKRRHDLIPKLIEAVKQYADYEEASLTAITELRVQSESLNAVADASDKSLLEHKISTGLGKLIAIAEDYPDLKANQSFLDLQYNLTEVENQIQFARRYYNGAVRNLNIRIESFPDLIVARMFSFKKADFFDFDEKPEAE